MKPNRKLAQTTTPDGACLTLHEHDGSFCIRMNGQGLMHSSVTSSEIQLGELAVARVSSRADPSVLVGGLGLGYTLKSVLQNVGSQAKILVVELIPCVVDWNREFLAGMNGALLNDPRVEISVADVWDVISRSGRDQYDAILLDIDNGPTAMVQKQNARLYDRRGLRMMADALKRCGRVACWSARPDPAFAKRLQDVGFKVEAVPAKLYPNAKRCTCTIYVADK